MRIPEIGKQQLEATRISMSSSEETELIGRTPTTRRQGSVYVIVSDSQRALGGSTRKEDFIIGFVVKFPCTYKD